MSTKVGKKYLDKNGLSYFRQKFKEELKNEQLWEQGENTDGSEGGVQIAYYGNAVGEASVSEGVAYNYKKSLDEIIPISIKSLSSEEKTAITNYIGSNNYNYVIKLDFSSIDDPVTSSLYDLCNEAFNLSVCEYVENAENTSISELSNVKNIKDITENTDIISIFEGSSDFSQLEITNNENLEWGLLELDDISVNKNSTYIIGISTGAFGVASHSEGYYTTANGDYSHAEGNISSAEGVASHSEGSFTHAEGSDSHAEGYSTKANGRASHAEGAFSHAEGYGSHAEGSSSHAEGYSSHAEGNHSITTNLGEHAEGRYNKSNTGTISSIGIGTSDTDRKNAFEVMTDGDIYVNGIGDYDGTNAVNPNSEGKTAKTLQECVLNNKGETGNSILFYEDGITTDTDNKADVPTGFSVRVGDLVIDENYNLYKCIEE